MQANNDCDDTAETLSLCDLPLNSFASDSDDFDHKRPASFDDHDLFEFITHDFTASSYNNNNNDPAADTIIFCGKLIPYKVAAEFSSNGKRRKSTDTLPSTKKISIFKSRWYLFAFGMGKFPMEMKLSDMKMRQSRRNPSNKSSLQKKSLWNLLKVWFVRVNKLVL